MKILRKLSHDITKIQFIKSQNIEHSNLLDISQSGICNLSSDDKPKCYFIKLLVLFACYTIIMEEFFEASRLYTINKAAIKTVNQQ